MTDIVERLRDYADGLSGYAADMMGDAADEIERLRREREIFSQALNDANDWGGELYADNERLRDEVHFDDQTIKSLFEIKDRLEKKNERLRAICKELLQHAEYLLSETEKAKEKDVTLLQTRILRARAALKEGE